MSIQRSFTDESPLTLEELTAPQSQFQLVRFVHQGRRTVWEAHVRAVYIAQYFIHACGSQRSLMLHINGALEGDRLPLGDPDFMIWPLPPEQSLLEGSVVAIRATWPSDRELGL